VTVHRNSIDLASAIRRNVVEMTAAGGSSHVGSCLSIADIMAVLYADVLHVDPAEPELPDRDRFILSKGHAGAAVYATLAECGFFDVEKLLLHYQDGSDLSGHVCHKNNPGVEFSTGSLGHGLGVSTGLAYASKAAGSLWGAYCLLSDGEWDEGSNWEAVLFAAHHRLANLTAVVDYNKIQSLGPVSETLGLEPFASKFESFGWAVSEADGHDHEALRACFRNRSAERPNVIIAHTTKGKGVSFMENSVLWHYRAPAGSELEAARQELEEAT